MDEHKFMLNGKEYSSSGDPTDGWEKPSLRVDMLRGRENGAVVGSGRKIMSTFRVGTVISAVTTIACIAACVHSRLNMGASGSRVGFVEVICLVFMAIGAFMEWQSAPKWIKKAKKCTVEVPGVISNVRVSRGSDSDTYAPDFTYMYNGVEYTLKMKVYTNRRPKVGEQVTMCVDPTNPSDAYEPKTVMNLMKTSYIIGNGFFIMASIAMALMHS